MKKYILKTLFVICFVSLSSAYFLFIYNKEGLFLTVSCLLSWGYCIALYSVLIWILFVLFLDYE